MDGVGWLILVQWLHILGGIAWVGGYVFIYLGLWPALFRRPAPEARAVYEALGPPAGALMGMAGQLVIWLGLLRGTVFGPIRSFGALVGTPYGHTFLAAFVLTIGAAVYGGVERKHLDARVWQGEGFHPGARAYVRRGAVVTLSLFAAVVACMVLMRYGI